MSGQRVRQVRELLGWTQTALAERSHIDQAQISRIEAGADYTITQIRSISEATGFPLNWVASKPPIEFPEGTIRYRKKSKAPKRDDRRAVRRLELAYEIVDRLSDNTVKPPPVTLRF